MKLYLLRHAKADPRGKGIRDDKRHLTSKGKMDAFEAAKKWKKSLKGIKKILSSPYPRALETADIFAGVMKQERGLVVEKALAPDTKASKLVKLLQSYENESELMIVGHEPSLSELASTMISGNIHSRIHLKKCGLIILEVDEMAPGGASLLRLI